LDSSSNTIETFSSSYDAVGHLLSSTNPDSTYTYTYDAVDRVSSIDNTGTMGVPAVKFTYAYDAVGNLVAVNDSINGTSAGITGYSYDLLNRVTQLTQGGTGVQSKQVNMTYNAVNQLTSLSRYSGVNSVADTSYVYDDNQRLIQLSHHQGASTVASYDYGYDNADKLASTVSSIDGTSNYSYDATNQLTGADHTNQTDEAYSYDANGNRTSGGTVTSANNQLLNDGTYSYTYDGEGNRTKRTEIATGKVTEYVWDYRNRLTSVLFKDASGTVTKTIEYAYDTSDRRIAKKIDGVTTERYVYDGSNIALVFDGAGSQTHRYLYGTGIDRVLADETPTQVLWALADNQGTVKDLTDNAGNAISHINYDSFGRVVSQAGSSDFRYGYTGREQDAETGLDYYRARYYDAANGRFISEDPLSFGAGDSNLNRYVFNSSVNYIDPTGKDVWIETGNPDQFPLHQKIIVGDINKSNDIGGKNIAVSFAPKENPGFWTRGQVYYDYDTGGNIVRYMKTTKEQDREIKKYLSSLVGREAVYDLPFLNCRKFSYDRFEQIKNKYSLIESSPPLRKSFVDEINKIRATTTIPTRMRRFRPVE
jgi:RHS repeat-associated protein